MENLSNKTNERLYKLINPIRNQMEFQMFCLDNLIPEDHKVREVWEFIDQMDINACYGEILTFQGSSGRSTTSPRVLLCLWIYSIMDGNISARKLEELCKYHNVYKWIAGGAPINRTMLSDFRSQNPEMFEDLLTTCLAIMVEEGLLSDQDFSQDGTRVKAFAGLGSVRREESIEELQKEMKQRIINLEKDLQLNPQNYDLRTKAAQKRAMKERSERLDSALLNLKKTQKKKVEQGKKTGESVTEKDLENVRTSTTDPEARKMKMGDSGFRVAYNVQFATGINSRVIFGVDVVNTLDPGTSPIMMQKVNNVLHALNMPKAKNWVADSAYSSKEDVEKVNNLFPDCNYYSPAKLKKGQDPKKYQKRDSEHVKKWRDSLDSPEMNEVYKHRCSTAEFSNAQTKNHGFTMVLVRGLKKVMGVAYLHAISNNITRYFDLRSKKVKLA